MKIGVGEVFIIAGQSNAQGRPNAFLSNNNVATQPQLDAVRVQPDRFDEAEFLGVTDPVSQSITTTLKAKKPTFSPLVSGRDAYLTPNSGISPLGNSIWYWVAFGEKIARQYQVPVALFNAAWNGTTIKAWQESTNPDGKPLGAPGAPGDGRYEAGAPYGIFKNVLEFYGSTYGVRSILWLQGETDAKALRDGAWVDQRVGGSNPTAQAQDYADKLRAVISQSRQDLQPRFGDDPLVWVVGKTSTFEGVSIYYPKVGQTQAETQSALTVRDGQERVITSGSALRGPDIDGIEERATGGGEPTHLAGQGLQKAAEAWYAAIHNSSLFTKDPLRPARLGTEPVDLMLDANGNITTPLPAGAQYVWYSGNGGRIDLNNPAGHGPTMPDGIIDPLVCIEYGDGTCALGGLVLPNSDSTPDPNPNPGTGSLAFQIVSYDCNSGVLQYRFTSGDNSPVNVTLPGIFGGTMNPNTVATHTFPNDARQGRTITGYATQSGNQANVNFTTSCTLSGNNPDPNPNPNPNPGSCVVGNPSSTLDRADCNGVEGWALDNSNLGQPVTYDIYVDGVKTYAGLTANGDRQDLLPYFGNNPAARYHGFRYDFPADASWKNGQNHTISVRICGVNNEMNGSPKTANGCSGGSQNPNPNPNPGTGSLAFQIVSYDCNSGVLQYKFSSNDGSPVNVTLPGIFGGTMNPNTVATHTFFSDARQGRAITGYATQSGNQANVNFTTSCNIQTNPNPNPDPNPNPNPNPGSCLVGNPSSTLDRADCNGVEGWALDNSNLGQPVTYDIYVDGVKTYSGLTANGDRPDLENHFGNPAFRYHGFRYDFPADASWKNGQNHTISVRICGVNNEMNGSPKTANGCSGGSQNPNPNPNPGTGSLAFQIVSYDCNSGVLQYKFTSNDNSPVNVTLPGIFGGTMNPNTVATHTFPNDARQGRNMTGYATQSGNQANINFTTSCNLAGARQGSVAFGEPVLDNELSLSVRPNPNNGQFEVELVVAANKLYFVGVTDLLGRILWKSDGAGTGSKLVKPIDLQGQFVGSAVVYLQSEGKRVSKLVLIKP